MHTSDLPADSELHDLAIELKSLWHAMVSGMHAQGPAEGLQRQQVWVLAGLAKGSRRMSELATCAGTSQASLTGIVDRLEERGLVTRERCSEDRRAIEVALTDLGREEMRRSHANMLSRLEEILAPLSDTERREFARLVRVLTAHAPSQHHPHPGC